MNLPRATVGLDIGGTKTLAALLAPDGLVVAQARIATTRGADGVVDGAVRAVQGVLRQAGQDAAALGGVGVGVPGIVDPATGTVRHAVNLGVDGVPLPLARRLADELGVGAVVENDLNVAAVGAAHLLPEPDGRSDDLAFLALGTGLAAGLVLDGALRRGSTGAAGEIGHVPVHPDGPVCACGQRGCLELYASGSAVEALWPPGTHGRSPDVPAPVALFEAATAGDPAATAAVQRYADAVAAAVRMLVLSVDVRHVVLGGGVAQLGEPLLEAVHAALVRQEAASAFVASLALPGRVRLAPGHVPVGAVGAAVLARAIPARPAAVRPAETA
ncbi:ROK family protein [Xylanimonas oleitrophica]|uniref:ROK family protein n=1 Tax=Xylanimonas oleitrophica TaxID=2607479 RepID=A0A2W5YJ26_9MICO|nr:ROK family protein [Xylanimonas oleitrophica]PZR55151.1 ROK family protein [Xylanimonas oleitrophica]